MDTTWTEARERHERLVRRMEALRLKVKRPIAAKLVTIIAVMLALSLGAVTAVFSILVSADVRVTAEDNNFNSNRRAASSLNEFFLITASSVRLSTAIPALAASPPRNKDILAITERPFVYPPDGNAQLFRYCVPSFTSGAESFFNEKLEDNSVLKFGENAVYRSDPGRGKTFLALFSRNGILGAGDRGVFVTPEDLDSILGDGKNVSFVIGQSGNLIAGQSRGQILDRAALPFAREMFSGGVDQRQMLFTAADGSRWFCAFQKLEGIAAAAVTVISYADVFEGVTSSVRRNMYISFAALIISVITMFLYSFSLSRPLKKLTQASRSFEEGKYDIKLKTMRRDEIGDLTKSFIGMRNGLENFEKFTNKALVALARQGRLTRSGTRKTATVCFALIRDFSELWGQHDAKEVVAFVNTFLYLMVPCITKSGGVVDKFLTQGGVVIMALWGTADSTGSAEKDALACIDAVLAMRSVLETYNNGRRLTKGDDEPLVKIGCGINTGDVIAGQMGSDERMEYTVIGDAVNLAARIEGPNDLFDTDILITEETYNLIGHLLVTEEMPGLEVKGKAEPLRVFAVVNRRGEPGPLTMEQVRACWAES